DASVRTIAGRWDGDNSHGGWALGVTSEKSAYKPRNLILQSIGKGGYEVVASGLRLELDKLYYVAISVRTDEDSTGAVTFYLKELPSGELQIAQLDHKASSGYESPEP